jgi:hypothetical protein
MEKIGFVTISSSGPESHSRPRSYPFESAVPAHPFNSSFHLHLRPPINPSGPDGFTAMFQTLPPFLIRKSTIIKIVPCTDSVEPTDRPVQPRPGPRRGPRQGPVHPTQGRAGHDRHSRLALLPSGRAVPRALCPGAGARPGSEALCK